VAPTAAGIVFAEKAQGVLAEMDRAVAAAERAAEGKAGEVRIGYNDFAIGGPLPDVIHAFRDVHSEIHVSLHRAGTEPQLDMLRRDKLDVCFVIAPVIAEGFNRQTVWRDRYCGVVLESDPLAAQSQIKLGDLSKRPHVLGDRKGWQAYRERLRRLYASEDNFPEIVAEGPDTSVVLGLVASGLGVTIYPSCIENIFRRGVAFRPIADTEATLDTAIVWNSDTSNPAARRFVETVLTYCARWPDGFYEKSKVTSLEPRRAGK